MHHMPLVVCPVCGQVVLAVTFPMHLLFAHITHVLRDAIATVRRTGKHMRSVEVHTEDDCAVCLTRLDASACVRLCACGHIFHKKCISQWWACDARSTTCPTCRLDYSGYPT